MSLHRIDPRFALPQPITRAVVLGDLDEWRAGLRAAGLEVGPEEGVQPQLIVAPLRLATEALTRRANAMLIEGDARRELSRAGYHAERLLLRPSRARPTLVLPLEHRRASAYAIERWSVLDQRWKVLRMRAARSLISRDLFPSWFSSIVTIGTRTEADPFMIAASRDLGLGSVDGWALTLGQGDALSRNVFHLFAPGRSTPDRVLKFARVAGYSDPFDRDERGLRIAEEAGAVASQRAPRLLGRFDVGGIHASVETAAVGRRLCDLLLVPAGRAEKLKMIESVAAWTLELGRRTAGSAEALTAERRRLQDDVVPRWSSLGVASDLVDRVSEIAAVAQHNDLGSWNVVVGEDGFTAVDWESARRFGLPLWDLFYFLADALVLLDGSPALAEKTALITRMFAGEAPCSQILFRWVQRAVQALEIPADAVGPLATLCWLHHSLSGGLRQESLASRTPEERAGLHGVEGVAEAWMTHQALGPAWNRWR